MLIHARAAVVSAVTPSPVPCMHRPLETCTAHELDRELHQGGASHPAAPRRRHGGHVSLAHPRKHCTLSLLARAGAPHPPSLPACSCTPVCRPLSLPACLPALALLSGTWLSPRCMPLPAVCRPRPSQHPRLSLLTLSLRVSPCCCVSSPLPQTASVPGLRR